MNCKICKEEIEFNFDERTVAELRQKRLCFSCQFWDEKVLMRKNHDPNAVVISGQHYYIGKEEQTLKYEMRGFGGQEFKIKFTAGKRKGQIVTTTNLWFNGKIPEHFRDKLTDNAVFKTKENKTCRSKHIK
jgi:hypothetical protein